MAVFDQREASRSSFLKNVGKCVCDQDWHAFQVIHHPLKCTLHPWIPFALHQWDQAPFWSKFFRLLIKSHWRFEKKKEKKNKLVSGRWCRQNLMSPRLRLVSGQRRWWRGRGNIWWPGWGGTHTGRELLWISTPPSRSHIKTPLACLLRSFWGLQLSKYATVLNFWLARCCTGEKERKLIFFFRKPDYPLFLVFKKEQDQHLQ